MLRTVALRLRDNWKSGLAVALINIPLSISLAVASLGADSPTAPLVGILTAIWGGLVASLFASSSHNIFGPAGALSGILIVFSLTVGPQYVPVVAVLSGLIILAMWGLRVAKYITLIPTSVLHGFLLAVAVTIAGTQLNWALGLVGLPAHETFAANIAETVRHIGGIDIMSFAVFVVFFVMLLLWKKLMPRVPGPLPAAVLGIALGYAASLGHLPGIMTLHDKFPSLEFALALVPSPSIFGVGTPEGVLGWLAAHGSTVSAILSASVVIAIIATLETLIAGKIAEKLTRTTFDKDIEVRGAGLANIASGLLGGMPTTAVLVRTALNAKSGANHRTSAFLAAWFTLAISWALFPVFTYLPVPVVSAILMSIAVGMVETHIYAKMYKFDRIGFVIAFVVALVSVLEDPMYGVVLGTLATLMLFVAKLSVGDMEVSVFRRGVFLQKRKFSEHLEDQHEDDVLVYKFSGPLNFLNVSTQIERIRRLERARAVIFTFNHVMSVDIDGIEAIEEQIGHLRSRGIDVVFSGLSNGVGATVAATQTYRDLARRGRIFAGSSAAIQALTA